MTRAAMPTFTPACRALSPFWLRLRIAPVRGQGQHVDVSMAATMLSVNERAGAQLSGIDTKGEPVALSAPKSHIYNLPDGRRVTIATSPIYTPMFVRFCAMMRRTDLLTDPRFASAPLRRQNLKALLAEVRAWILTFADLDELQAQVSEAGLAIGVIRSTQELAEIRMGQGVGGCRGGERSWGRQRADAGAALAVQRFQFAVSRPAGLSRRAQCRAPGRAERSVKP